MTEREGIPSVDALRTDLFSPRKWGNNRMYGASDFTTGSWTQYSHPIYYHLSQAPRCIFRHISFSDQPTDALDPSIEHILLSNRRSGSVAFECTSDPASSVLGWCKMCSERHYHYRLYSVTHKCDLDRELLLPPLDHLKPTCTRHYVQS
jgi:hypothetical protein